MRKNNDGYVIIYVIFVILFLCIVAIGTCSSALSNLQSQNEAVVQMKEKYAAEGEIEMLVAGLCSSVNGIPKFVDKVTIDDDTKPGEYVRGVAVGGISAVINDSINLIAEEGVNVTEALRWMSNDSNVLTMAVEFDNGGISAEVQLRISVLMPEPLENEPDGTEKSDDGESGEDDGSKNYTVSYSVIGVTSEYLTYTGGAA